MKKMKYVYNLFWLLMTVIADMYFQNSSSEFCDFHPRLEPNEKLRFFHRGENVSIVCVAGPARSGDDYSYLRWYRLINSTWEVLRADIVLRLSDVHFSTQTCDREMLVLRNLSASEDGTYGCLRLASIDPDGHSLVNYTQLVSVQLKMLEPAAPHIYVLPRTTEVVILEHSWLSLTCVTSGSPLPRVWWECNSLVAADCRFSKYCLLQIAGQVLLNHSLIIGYNTTICICHAKNEVGASDVAVTIAIYVAPEVSRSHYGIYANELTCDIQRAHPSPVILWQYQQYNCVDAGVRCMPSNGWYNFTADDSKVDLRIGFKGLTSTLHIYKKNVHWFVRCLAMNEAGSDSNFAVVKIPDIAKKGQRNVQIYVGASCGCLLAAICIIVAVFIWRRHRSLQAKQFRSLMSPYTQYKVNEDSDLLSQGHHLAYDSSWEYPRHKLEFVKVLGSGAFGQVWLARASDNLFRSQTNAEGRRASLKWPNNNNELKKSGLMYVAVKALKENSSDVEYRDLASEIKLLIYVGKHKNIVNLLGACTRNGSLFAIMEFCPHGNLLAFLKSKRPCFVESWHISLGISDAEFTYADLLSIIFQIVRGMDFLHSKKLLHRDLACRNILLGEHYIVKISDFGLARNLRENDCYLKTTGGLLPVKWLSPESLFDKIYTTKTDIWSFGVVLWEIFTLGGSPYPGLPVEDLFDFLKQGGRMSQPDLCPDSLYAIMTSCWEDAPANRPDFSRLLAHFVQLLKSNVEANPYLDLIEEKTACGGSAESGRIPSSASSTSSTYRKLLSLGRLIEFVARRGRHVSSAEDSLLGSPSRLSSSGSDDPEGRHGAMFV